MLSDIIQPQKKEILPYATIWMYIGDILDMLIETNQSQDRYCMIVLAWGN
jgi:hypothetical protein